MGVNKYRSNLLIVPEDSAIRQIANGFVTHRAINTRAVQVLPQQRGWQNALDYVSAIYNSGMNNGTHIVALIDCDNDAGRLQSAKDKLCFADRVFILGIAAEAEDLKIRLADIRTDWKVFGR